MSFWNQNITCNYSEIELEIDELSTLFLNYGNIYHGNQKNTQTVTDQTILGFIRHFLPDICIEDNKYLMNIGCKLWDKKHDILLSIEEFKKMNLGKNVSIKSKNKNKEGNKDGNINLIIKQEETENVLTTTKTYSFPIHTIYDFYCKMAYKHNKMVVSKRYFEKFFIDNYGDNLAEKNGTLWWNY
jgi:hypothetical protein